MQKSLIVHHEYKPVLGGHTPGDLGAVSLVLHHQDLELLQVVDKDLLEAAGQHVPGGGVGSVTDVRHLVHSLELPSHSVVNTLWPPPVALE